MKNVRVLSIAIAATIASSGVAWGQEAIHGGGEGLSAVVSGTGDAKTSASGAAVMNTLPGPARGSLYKNAAAHSPVLIVTDPEHPPSALSVASYISVAPQQTKKYKKHDLITIVVQQNSDASTVSVADSKKQQTFDAALQQFLALNAFGNGIQQIGKVASANKLPEIAFNYNNDTKANADQQRTDTFSARMTAEIADVKPNGTLVLEATAHVRIDKEDQMFRLTGICRAEDVAADNTIVSSQIAELDLSKDTAGDVKNGTKRGWLNSIIDAVGPF